MDFSKNIVKIKSGSTKPRPEDLGKNQLGYCTSDGVLYLGLDSSIVAINSGTISTILPVKLGGTGVTTIQDGRILFSKIDSSIYSDFNNEQTAQAQKGLTYDFLNVETEGKPFDYGHLLNIMSTNGTDYAQIFIQAPYGYTSIRAGNKNGWTGGPDNWKEFLLGNTDFNSNILFPKGGSNKIIWKGVGKQQKQISLYGGTLTSNISFGLWDTTLNTWVMRYYEDMPGANLHVNSKLYVSNHPFPAIYFWTNDATKEAMVEATDSYLSLMLQERPDITTKRTSLLLYRKEQMAWKNLLRLTAYTENGLETSNVYHEKSLQFQFGTVYQIDVPSGTNGVTREQAFPQSFRGVPYIFCHFGGGAGGVVFDVRIQEKHANKFVYRITHTSTVTQAIHFYWGAIWRE